MKFITYIVLLVGITNSHAQSDERKIFRSLSKSILIELTSLEKITLNVHDNSDEIIVSYVDTSDENVPEITDENGTVHIRVAQSKITLKGTEKNKYRAGQPLFPSYHIKIPKGLDVKLMYAKGNFETRYFNGKLELRLDTGTVKVDKFEGNLNVQSFAGLINCKVTSGFINVNSVKGKIHADLYDEQLKKTKTSLHGIYVNANNVLKINSIHAKVNLKSALTQK